MAPCAALAKPAPQPKCLVRINDGKVAAGNGRMLARKLAGAAAGDTIHLGGNCVGNFTITGQLTLIGDLSADDVFLIGGGAGSVLTIPAGADVTITRLLINGGNANVGGGIFNEGHVALGAGAIVLGNNEGGGVFNSGTLELTDDATISVNFSFNNGGGIYNAGTATIGDNAAVRDNTASSSPAALVGGGIFNEGTLTLRGSASVARNFVVGAGGGIFNSGTLNLEGGASITDNDATSEGGGISSGESAVLNIDAAWTGSTCSPANSPNDFDASTGNACP
jgi:hypothetical protein